MGELIPLFPLSTPLFPGVVLPLQIFEPRYRRLVRDLVALPEGSDRRFFGVVGIRQGWEVERIAPAEALYDIGCTARLQDGRDDDPDLLEGRGTGLDAEVAELLAGVADDPGALSYLVASVSVLT